MKCDLYHTRDMTIACVSMLKRNRLCILRTYYKCLRPIRFRGNTISNIPSILAKRALAGHEDRMLSWQNAGGLLIDTGVVDLTQCQAMLLIEAPLGFQQCSQIANNIENEMIIYKPPNWELHEETINYFYPSVERIKQFLDAVKDIKNEDHPLALEAIKRSKFKNPICFKELPGFNQKEFQAIARQLPLYKKYVCYRPQIPPTNDDLEYYTKLEASPDIHHGWRMADNRQMRPIKYGAWRLIRFKNVETAPSIYVVDISHNDFDFVKIKAIADARREDWATMRTMIDLSPEYPI